MDLRCGVTFVWLNAVYTYIYRAHHYFFLCTRNIGFILDDGSVINNDCNMKALTFELGQTKRVIMN
jgi:hypothetical protein